MRGTKKNSLKAVGMACLLVILSVQFLMCVILLQECSNMKSLLWIWSVLLANSVSYMFVGSWEEEDLYMEAAGSGGKGDGA